MQKETTNVEFRGQPAVYVQQMKSGSGSRRRRRRRRRRREPTSRGAKKQRKTFRWRKRHISPQPCKQTFQVKGRKADQRNSTFPGPSSEEEGKGREGRGRSHGDRYVWWIDIVATTPSPTCDFSAPLALLFVMRPWTFWDFNVQTRREVKTSPTNDLHFSCTSISSSSCGLEATHEVKPRVGESRSQREEHLPKSRVLPKGLQNQMGSKTCRRQGISGGVWIHNEGVGWNFFLVKSISQKHFLKLHKEV
ncbi:hypothetical protein MPTK2_8g03960 [Marchantia polymorpha subsp. ruderalis]